MMQLNEDFIISEMGDQYIMVAAGSACEHFNGMIRLNQTSLYLLDHLKKLSQTDELKILTDQKQLESLLIQALKEKYEVQTNEACEEIESFIHKLIEVGFLENTL